VSSKANNQVKFIENISVSSQTNSTTTAPAKITPPAGADKAEKKETFNTRGLNIEETRTNSGSIYGDRSAAVEMASPVQLKYSVLLNTEVEQLKNRNLLESVDEWYGTRYRLGGTTKAGIDCSAFVQASFLAAFGISLPRTAREQYKASTRISRTELKEGDLVFFNTRGGVSHVGIYLQNNKFIHASTSQGVVVSDMFEAYYLKRYIGAGRMDNAAMSSR
ncbi:MAG TPA: NlpC/P60 family protein, partial [Chitinophagaceae bacterium]